MVSRKGLRHFMIVFALAALALSGCAGHESLNVLDPSGTSAEKSLDLIKWSIFIMMGVFAIVISIYIYVLVRYRKRKGKDVMPKQVHGSTIVEIIWTAIPIILITIWQFRL